jgi:hypothetical protein
MPRPPKLTPDEKLALVQTHCWTVAYVDLEAPPAWQKAARWDWELIQLHGPPFSTSDWVTPSAGPAERRQCLRAVERLEEIGLLVCHRPAGRLTHVRTTDEGDRLALKLMRSGDHPPVWLWLDCGGKCPAHHGP